jgi:hypothetical protein
VNWVIGNRLNLERLDFVYKYVFPPDHNCLLSVREHKKERAAMASSSANVGDEESNSLAWESQNGHDDELPAA